jgi:secondary thiamine-phosphate synthase enzyme
MASLRVHTERISVPTRGKGTYEITGQISEALARSGIAAGTLTLFIQHTSCSLIIMENADPSARRDLEEFFDRLVPENAPYFEHTSEGPDDMPSHIRMVLTRSSEVIPIANSQLQLGTWQGIFLFEHRQASHDRKIVVTIIGEGHSGS